MERLTARNKEGQAHATRVGYLDIVDRLAEYEDAEEQGLLLRLPFKEGSTVYHVVSNMICEVENVDLFFLLLSVAEKRFGKTVFLTYEEAERALAEMKGEQENGEES